MEFTFRDYVRVLFRQKAVVLICVLTVGITVFVNLALKTPVYDAQVKMLISAEKQIQSPYYREVYGEHNTKVALTQSEIVKSGPVLERTVQALGLDQKPANYERKYASPLKAFLMDVYKNSETKTSAQAEDPSGQLAFRNAVAALKDAIRVEPIRDTNLFIIKVRDFDAVQAAMIANVISRSYIIFDLEQQLADLTLKYGEKHPAVQQLRDNVDRMVEKLNGNALSNIEAIGPATVKIIEQANIPLEPTGPRKKLSLLLAFFVGSVMGIVLAFIFEYMDPTFKS
ncbi:MAG: Wzz/FepE/Etk N-terminal domain-containing protein, partial [Candidatus Omnitrophica bacterium]|nr:Wzz/FepE/Etk N-terminal domain-containing protein [Candidatus Omnitrophota bacterium]